VNGTLPPALRLPGLSHLRSLACSGCGLTGTLPADWGSSNTLQALRHLSLGGNQFTGALPPSWGGLVNLANLTLSGSQASTGSVPEIPQYWGNMRSLAFANLSGVALAETACAPDSWALYNGLVLDDTLLLPSDLGFCTVTSPSAAAAAAAAAARAAVQRALAANASTAGDAAASVAVLAQLLAPAHGPGGGGGVSS
jgi:hypothetical protein